MSIFSTSSLLGPRSTSETGTTSEPTRSNRSRSLAQNDPRFSYLFDHNAPRDLRRHPRRYENAYFDGKEMNYRTGQAEGSTFESIEAAYKEMIASLAKEKAEDAKEKAEYTEASDAGPGFKGAYFDKISV